MKAKIIEKIILDGIPSASGIEIVDDNIFIIGDDSPYLYCLDLQFKLINKIELFQSNDFSSGRIPKHIKPDLECISLLNFEGEKYLLITGSGSKETRNNAFLVKLPENGNQDYQVKLISFTELYQNIKDSNHANEKSLNMEALAINDDYAFLMNRSNNKVPNVISIYKYNDLSDFLKEQSFIPQHIDMEFNLEGLNNINAGFSGAVIYNEKLFFTASVEDTSDPVLDGIVHGSFIGYFAIENNNHDKVLSELKGFSVIEENDKTFSGKVESIAILEAKNERLIALAVTDNDLGGSELLKIEIEF